MKPVPVAELTDVYRVYRSAEPVHALRDINLRLQGGQCIAVVGKSGSGKSTLLNILGLLDRPDRGSYTLDGRGVHQAGERARAALRASHVGFVFQQFHLIGYRTALQNVELGLQATSLPRRRRVREAELMLQQVGLGVRIDHYPSQLSGGEQQRVAIARALVSMPVLLLCDEPTGNLDSQTGSKILDLIFGLRAPSRIVVLVTHDRDVAERADRIIEMIDGRVTDEWAYR